MYSSLLLDFGGVGSGNGLGDVTWIIAFLLWIPQLVALRFILKRRRKARTSLVMEIVQVLALFGLLVLGIFYGAGGCMLIIGMYSDIEWSNCLLALLSPTVAGLLYVIASNRLYWKHIGEPAPPIFPPMLLSDWIFLLVILALALAYVSDNSSTNASLHP